MATTLDKVIQLEPVAMQIVTAGSSVLSPVYPVAQAFLGRIFWDVAIHDSTTDPTPPKLEVQVSQHASGSDTWVSGCQRLTAQLNGGENTTLGVDVFANDTFFNIPGLWATAGYSSNRWVFIEDVTFANSEWINPISVVGPTTTVRDPLLFDHASTSNIFQAARYTLEFDLRSVQRIRVAVYNNVTRTGVATDHVVRVGLIVTEAVNP